MLLSKCLWAVQWCFSYHPILGCSLHPILPTHSLLCLLIMRYLFCKPFFFTRNYFFVKVIIARLMGVQSTALGFHRHTRRHHPVLEFQGWWGHTSLWSYSIHSRLRMSTCSKCPTSRYVMISMFSSCTDHSSLSSVFTALTPFYALNSCYGWTSSSTYRNHPL
jgi:hypothetical protein